jgi:hypothetical protein
VDQFADRFRGCTADDIELLMQSFLLDKCCRRTELAAILRDYARMGPPLAACCWPANGKGERSGADVSSR